jgi:hypothetical protein
VCREFLQLRVRDRGGDKDGNGVTGVLLIAPPSINDENLETLYPEQRTQG